MQYNFVYKSGKTEMVLNNGIYAQLLSYISCISHKAAKIPGMRTESIRFEGSGLYV